jgi:hypothetical protein
MADIFLRALRNRATGVRSRSPLKTVALADAERLATGMRMTKRRDYACAYVPKSRDGVSIVSEELVRVLRTSATVDALRAGADFVHASVHATEFQIDHGFKIGFLDWSRELACDCYRTIVNEY